MAMNITAIASAPATPPAASQHHPAAAAATAINTAISATCGPPTRNEDGPAAWVDADRAGVLNAENLNPLTEASAASVGQSRHLAALAFPATKAEANEAARLALVALELKRTELGGYVATRWDSEPVMLADLAAVATFAHRVGAPQ